MCTPGTNRQFKTSTLQYHAWSRKSFATNLDALERSNERYHQMIARSADWGKKSASLKSLSMQIGIHFYTTDNKMLPKHLPWSRLQHALLQCDVAISSLELMRLRRLPTPLQTFRVKPAPSYEWPEIITRRLNSRDDPGGMRYKIRKICPYQSSRGFKDAPMITDHHIPSYASGYLDSIGNPRWDNKPWRVVWLIVLAKPYSSKTSSSLT